MALEQKKFKIDRGLVFGSDILAYALFTFELCLFGFPFWAYVAAAVLLLEISPWPKVRSLAALNLVFWIVTQSIFAVSPNRGSANLILFHVFLDNVRAPEFAQPWIPCAAFVLFIALYYGLIRLLNRWRGLRSPVPVTLAVLCGLGIGQSYLDEYLVLKFVLVGAMFAFGKVYWMLNYQLSEFDVIRKRPFWEHLGTLSSPWQSGWANYSVIRGYSDYFNALRTDVEERRELRWSAVRLLTYAILLNVLASRLNAFAVNKEFEIGPLQLPGLSHLLGKSFDRQAYLAQDLSVGLSWLYIIIQCLQFLLMLTSYTDAVVGVARMCGFSLRRNVHHPLGATSFNSFISRIYFYYIAVLQRLFFYPLWGKLRFIRNKRVRVFCVYFATVVMGGLVNTIVRLTPGWAVTIKGQSVGHSLINRLPYLMLLGTFCALSAIGPKPNQFFQHPLWRYPKVLSYFLLYALCYSLQLRYEQISLGTILAAFLHLFGLT